ncbi:MAG: asparagine synthetase B, partial [bacterium]|nr:asparagine synthetase B [bacterium]
KNVWTRDIFEDVFAPIKQKMLSPDDCINSSLYLESKTFLHGLLSVEDKLSMAHSLEARVPFLDNDLVDFAQNLPNSLKIKKIPLEVKEVSLEKKAQASRHGKVVLRKTLSRHLDKKITEGKKQGFSSPDASWFRGESIDYIKKELSGGLDLFNNDVIKQLLDSHISGKENHRLAIWALLYLKRFQEKVIPSPK